jgi:hypothetical protein
LSCKNCGLPEPDHPAHGTLQGYAYHKCRCAKCRQANADAARARRAEFHDYYLTYERARAKTPKRQKSRRAYSAANSEELKRKSSEFRKNNLHLYKGYSARRRYRQKLSKQDAMITAEYRLAIAKDPCWYCNDIGAIMHDDHYFPLGKGGTDHWFNLVRACDTCNFSKGSRCGTWFKLRDYNEYTANK